MVILQSRGQGPDSCWKYGTDLFRSFGTCPLDLRITLHVHVDMVFLQQSWHILVCWKIARTQFQCMVVLQSREQHFILVEIWWSQDLRVEHMCSIHSNLKQLPCSNLVQIWVCQKIKCTPPSLALLGWAGWIINHYNNTVDIQITYFVRKYKTNKDSKDKCQNQTKGGEKRQE